MNGINIVLLVLNAWVAVLFCNAEIPAEISIIRVDAEQDPLISVTVVPPAGSPTSVLFDSCLTASLTISGKFASIVLGTANTEYLRYVPDTAMMVKVPWKKLNNSGNILDCGDAAANAGYPMFTYDGKACLVDNSSYDTTVPPACEDNATNAVFINPAGTCKYPNLKATPDTCLKVLPTASHLVGDVGMLCGEGLYKTFDYNQVVATLKLYNPTSNKLIVNSEFASGRYTHWTNASYFVNASDATVNGTVLMNPAKNYLFEVDTTGLVPSAMLCFT